MLKNALLNDSQVPPDLGVTYTQPDLYHELTRQRFLLRSALPLAVVVLLLLTFLVGPYGLLIASILFWLRLQKL